MQSSEYAFTGDRNRNNRQKHFYSGKKKRHTLKSQVVHALISTLVGHQWAWNHINNRLQETDNSPTVFPYVSTFPDISGFSYRNLKYMRQFAEAFPEKNWAAAAAQIPWGHNI